MHADILEMRKMCIILIVSIFLFFHECESICTGYQTYTCDTSCYYYNRKVCRFMTPETYQKTSNLDHSLMFTSVNISKLHVNSFWRSPTNLRRLYMNETNISEIQPGAFNNLINLNELHLQNNNISHITRGVFNSLTVLKFLNLSSNQIESIEDKSFLGLYNLSTLDISYNRLFILADVNVLNLKNLNASHNSLNSLSSISWDKSNALKNLDLSHNRITEINYTSLQGFGSLEDLQLQENKIRQLSIGSFKDLSLLKKLNLSYNFLKNLEIGIFTGLHKLQVLDLSTNNFSTLPDNSFHDLIQLNTLYLNSNPVKLLDKVFLDQFSSLKALSISNVSLTCPMLLSLISFSKQKNITIIPGKATNQTNIFGIPCTNKTEVQVVHKKQEIDSGGKISVQFDGSHFEEVKKFFVQDFQDTQFYKFFNANENTFFKNFDEQFQTTRFYKYFNEDFVNSPFFVFFEKYYLNDTFREIISEKVHAQAAPEVDGANVEKKADIQAILSEVRNTMYSRQVSLKNEENHIDSLSKKISTTNTILLLVLVIMSLILLVFLYLLYDKIVVTKRMLKTVANSSNTEANVALL